MGLFNVYPLFDITPVRAQDVYIYDKDDNEYLDLYGGHAVISIGHSHPTYVKRLSDQLDKIAFYSNSIQNPLQQQMADKLARLSGCHDYDLFLCNSGAEANENALKVASFATGKKKVIAFNNSFHGRTSAAVAVTDNPKIVAPINAQQEVIFCELGDVNAVEKALETGDVCCIIIETIQGVGGLDEATTSFFDLIVTLSRKHNCLIIADEVQSGFGRTGDFFAFQKHKWTPDLIPIAKGMGNGFPVGGVLIHHDIKASFGMLGTTFGGNHLACTAVNAVLDVIESENLMQKANDTSTYFLDQIKEIKEIKRVKGRGLMLGLEFDFPIAELRKDLILNHRIFTGNSKNPNLIRILPSLTVQQHHLDHFVTALKKALKTRTS
ncbi:aspartate aminotransferase family protein [Nonlabens ponticola]|uniref:Aspartate aminotransferase family protein n=1 Tax=Nonlabens ponticola TaxID=2496866 RepID=A0A3S9MZ53_9FLAO|nr:aminotransferase class III-fold pyridoxal phosphate-dependent enzyme [Nonlabens ponticola]AZQ44343.1 aspartate aminotransferase family protein [Nonlabens ponticola]